MKNQNILLIFYCSGHTWEMFLAATKIWNFPSCVEAFNGPLYIIFQFTYVTWEKHSYVYIGNNTEEYYWFHSPKQSQPQNPKEDKITKRPRDETKMGTYKCDFVLRHYSTNNYAIYNCLYGDSALLSLDIWHQQREGIIIILYDISITLIGELDIYINFKLVQRVLQNNKSECTDLSIDISLKNGCRSKWK